MQMAKTNASLYGWPEDLPYIYSVTNRLDAAALSWAMAIAPNKSLDQLAQWITAREVARVFNVRSSC
jgi:hypothetical protein